MKVMMERLVPMRVWLKELVGLVPVWATKDQVVKVPT